MAANGHGGSPCHLCRHIAALVAGGLQLHLHRSEVRQWGLVCVYLAEILLELTIALIATNELLQERSHFPREGHILRWRVHLLPYVLCYFDRDKRKLRTGMASRLSTALPVYTYVPRAMLPFPYQAHFKRQSRVAQVLPVIMAASQSSTRSFNSERNNHTGSRTSFHEPRQGLLIAQGNHMSNTIRK